MIEIINFLNVLDIKLLFFLNGFFRNPVFDVLMPWFEDNRIWLMPIVIFWVVVMIWGGKRGRWAGVIALVLIALSDQLSSNLIKPLFERMRPCNVLSGLHFWKNNHWIITPETISIVYKKSYSFPSSHAANTFAQALWWGWIYPRSMVLWLVLAFIIGYSRIYIGVHYPSDVLGGWVIGGFSFTILFVLTKKWGPMVMRSDNLSDCNNK